MSWPWAKSERQQEVRHSPLEVTDTPRLAAGGQDCSGKGVYSKMCINSHRTASVRKGV